MAGGNMDSNFPEYLLPNSPVLKRESFAAPKFLSLEIYSAPADRQQLIQQDAKLRQDMRTTVARASASSTTLPMKISLQDASITCPLPESVRPSSISEASTNNGHQRELPETVGRPFVLESSSNDHRPKDVVKKKPLQKKLIFVGNDAIGILSLLSTFVHGTFPTDWIPRVYEGSCVDVEVDGISIKLSLWCTNGAEDYDRLRPLSYTPHPDIIVLCFAIDAPYSFECIEEKWLPEIFHYMPGVPILLAGLISDTRYDPKAIRHQDPDWRIITYEEGQAMARKICDMVHCRYVECSPKTGVGIDELIKTALRMALDRDRTGKKRKCCVM